MATWLARMIALPGLRNANYMAVVANLDLRGLLIDQNVESSRSADSRRANAHESGSSIGFPDVAQTMTSTHWPGTGQLLCYNAGCTANLEWVARASTHVESVAALCQRS